MNNVVFGGLRRGQVSCLRAQPSVHHRGRGSLSLPWGIHSCCAGSIGLIYHITVVLFALPLSNGVLLLLPVWPSVVFCLVEILVGPPVMNIKGQESVVKRRCCLQIPAFRHAMDVRVTDHFGYYFSAVSDFLFYLNIDRCDFPLEELL